MLISLERGSLLDRTYRTARHANSTRGLLADCGPPGLPCPPSALNSSSRRARPWPSSSPSGPNARIWSRRPSAGPHDKPHGFSTGAAPRKGRERHELLLVHQRLPPSAALTKPRVNFRTKVFGSGVAPKSICPSLHGRRQLRRRGIHRRREEGTKVRRDHDLTVLIILGDGQGGDSRLSLRSALAKPSLSTRATKVVMAGMQTPPAAACLDTGWAAPGQARRLHHVYRTQTRPTSRGDLGVGLPG